MKKETNELINKAKVLFPELNNVDYIETTLELDIELSEIFFKYFLLNKKIDPRFTYFINSFFEKRNLNSEEEFLFSEFALNFSTKENEQMKNELFYGLNDNAKKYFNYSIKLWRAGNNIQD